MKRIVIMADHRNRRTVLGDLHSDKTAGTVYYGVCGLCGLTRWRSSSPTEDGLLVAQLDEFSPNECEACNYMFQRMPEIATWIQNVVQAAAARIRDEIEASLKS
jgi:ribosomal protein S27AE